MVIGISVVLIITSLLMVLLVLLHKGKGGGLSDLFTGVVWFLCIVGLNLLLNH